MAPRFRNHMPEHGIRVPVEVLCDFAVQLLRSSGMEEEGAALVAGKLVACDRRCVFSHGTKALEHYLPLLRDGKVNPRPEVRIEAEDGATVVIDGDGGLGYHACQVGMELAVARAQRFGVGAATTYHHHHVGAAGNWARMALEADCISLVISSHRFFPREGEMVLFAGGSSPISVAVPAGEQPPLVLDMGARLLPFDEGLMGAYPQAFLKALGIGSVNAVLGGLLAGVWRPEATRPGSRWEAGQGSLLTAWRIANFRDTDNFKDELDRHIGLARKMEPLPPFDRAELAGGMEFAWEKQSDLMGVLLSPEHEDLLTILGKEMGIKTPWANS